MNFQNDTNKQNDSTNQQNPKIEFGSDSVIRVRDINQYVYSGKPNEYCQISNHKINDNDDVFMCPICKREPILSRYINKEWGCCTDCVNILLAEESKRERCGRLRMKVDTPFGNYDVFLFAKRTLQVGRSREGQIKLISTSNTNQYTPKNNDLVLRVVEDGTVNKERSCLVSRAHAVFRLINNDGRDRLQILDCGKEGGGSSYGTWINGTNKLPSCDWYILSDQEEILFGKEIGISGIQLTSYVLRNSENPSLIDAVCFTSDDDLGERHKYIMVVNSATFGLGPNLAISLAEEPSKVWGEIRVEEGSYVFYPQTNSPIRWEQNSSAVNSIPLLPGTNLQAQDIRIACHQVVDKDFYSTV